MCSYCEKKCVKQDEEICCADQRKLRTIDNIMNRAIDEIKDSLGDKNASE
jgi:DNA-directed RNA polymerase alpha subunit|tara:strand:- start:413 stop:562 length:150 start_codon:yes stop_codon:yes gene_type:complete